MQLYKNHAEGVYEIRSLSAVWNQGASLVWNHHEVMYGINPKVDTRWRVMPYACGDYILAHARLHTNPSDWIEKRPFRELNPQKRTLK